MKAITRLTITAACVCAFSFNANAQFLQRLLESAAQAAEYSLESCVERAIERGIEKSFERTEKRIDRKLNETARTYILVTDYGMTGRDVILCSDLDTASAILAIERSGMRYDKMAVIDRKELKKFKNVERIAL